jgi:non-ribosomal peptide synthetase component F
MAQLPRHAWEPDLIGPALEAPGGILPMVEAAMRDAPERIAVSDPGGAFTYAEFDAVTAGIARILRASPTSAARPVLMHARLSRWAIAAMIGALRAGVGSVPVDAGLPAERRDRIAAACGAFAEWWR